MDLVTGTISYVLLFIALYFEVFLLITYFEKRSDNRKPLQLPVILPTITIIVPIWNEETTVLKTIFSILKLDYPKDKLSVFIVDDGSTDNTWKVIQRFKRNSQVTLLRKENGGKHTALNYALQFVTSDLVGCLDADSYVHPQALRRIVSKFNEGDYMAVTPSIKVHEPKGIIQLIQKVEYGWGVLLRNTLAHLGAIYVTPGPLSIFKREVFLRLGGYRKAHNTEDMEIALRMHENKMRIGNAPDAFIYTSAPRNLKSLYKQRLRWTYGFMKNAIDYKHMFFNPRYGNLGMVMLPIASLSLFSSTYLVAMNVWGWIVKVVEKVTEVNVIGLNFNTPSFELFYVNTTPITIISYVAIIGTIALLFFSRQMAEGNRKPGWDMFLFMFLYVFITPIWVTRAMYNVVFAKKTSWR